MDKITKLWQRPNLAELFEKYSEEKPYSLKEGTIIFNEGQPLDRIYYIKDGFVKLYRLSEEGRESTIYLHGPGQILGVRALTSEDGKAKHFAESITDTAVLSMTHKKYFETLSDHPEYLVDLLHVFIDRLNYTEKKLEAFVLSDTTARIAFFLVDCHRRFCKAGEMTLPIPLTHQRIAEFVGSFRETVTITLNGLEKEKILSVKKGRVKILNLPKLKKYAGL